MWLESAIDFSDEDIAEKEHNQYYNQIKDVGGLLVALIKRADVGYKVAESFSIVLVGPPNVGKSSLFNYLCNKDAAIVSDIAGTTRDVLEQPLIIGDVACNLLDTAGLHSSSDKIEQAGIDKAKVQISAADLVLLMADASQNNYQDIHNFWQENISDEFASEKILIVWNKIDLNSSFSSDRGVKVSVKNKIGLDDLSQAILGKVGIDTELLDTMIPAQQYQLTALKQALNYIKVAQHEIKNNSLDVVAENLKLAHNTLAEIYGDSHHETILDHIFSNFCIGK